MAVIDLARLDDDPPMRRVAALEIEPSWLLALLRGMGRHGCIHQIDGLPEDARVISMTANPGRNTLTLYLESDQFPPCAPGCEPVILRDLTLTVFELSPEQRTQLESWMSR